MEERNCACCGVRLTDDYVLTANDEIICDDCAENEYTRCECCNNLVYNSDIYGEDYDHILCHTCYEEYYTNCDECGDLIDRDNAYSLCESSSKSMDSAGTRLPACLSER